MQQGVSTDVSYLDFLIQPEKADLMLAKLSKGEIRDFLYRFLAELHRDECNQNQQNAVAAAAAAAAAASTSTSAAAERQSVQPVVPSRKAKCLEYLALLCVAATGWRLSELHSGNATRSTNSIPCGVMLNLLKRFLTNSVKTSENEAEVRCIEAFVKNYLNLGAFIESTADLKATLAQLGDTTRFALWTLVRFAVQCNMHSRLSTVTSRRGEQGKPIAVVPNLPGSSQILFMFAPREDEADFAEVNRESLAKLLTAFTALHREGSPKSYPFDSTKLKRLFGLHVVPNENDAAVFDRTRLLAESCFDLGAFCFTEKRFDDAAECFRECRLVASSPDLDPTFTFDFDRARLAGYLAALESLERARPAGEAAPMDAETGAETRPSPALRPATWRVPRDVLAYELVAATRAYASDAEANRIELLLGTTDSVERVRELLAKLGWLPTGYSVDILMNTHAASTAVRQTAAAVCEQFEAVLSPSIVASAKQLALLSPHTAILTVTMLAKGMERARVGSLAQAEVFLSEADSLLNKQARTAGNNSHAQAVITRLQRRVERERLVVQVRGRLHVARCAALTRFPAACNEDRELDAEADADADVENARKALTDRVCVALTELLNDAVAEPDALDDRFTLLAAFLINVNLLDELHTTFTKAGPWNAMAARGGSKAAVPVARGRFFALLGSLLREIRDAANGTPADARTRAVSRSAKDLFDATISSIFADAVAPSDADDSERFVDWLDEQVLPRLTQYSALTLLCSLFAHAYVGVRAVTSDAPLGDLRPLAIPVSSGVPNDSLAVECEWPSVAPLLAAAPPPTSAADSDARLHAAFCGTLRRLFDTALQAAHFRSRSEPATIRLAADVRMLEGDNAAAVGDYLELASVLSNAFRCRSPARLLHARPRLAAANNAPAGWPTIHNEVVQRLATLASRMRMHTHAACLWQFHAASAKKRPPSDYAAACASLRDSIREGFADETDACYRFFFDAALLEYIAALHDRRGELPKRDLALEFAASPFTNEHNAPELLDALAFRRKAAFFAYLFDVYCGY